MNQEDLYRQLIPLARQNVYIVVSTKLQFQRVIRGVLGSRHLAAINASVNPFILPLIRYNINFDVFIFVLF